MVWKNSVCAFNEPVYLPAKEYISFKFNHSFYLFCEFNVAASCISDWDHDINTSFAQLKEWRGCFFFVHIVERQSF